MKKNPFHGHGIEEFRLGAKLFERLDVSGTHGPLLLVRVPEIQEFDPAQAEKGAWLYLPFQDPRNVGAILRTAAAFGLHQIILGPGAAHPFHPLCSRSASGCVFDHRYWRAQSTPAERFRGRVTIGLDMDGEKLSRFKFPENFILIPGAEGPGLDKNLNPTHRITIPMTKDTESLNANTATAIALYEWSKNRLG